MTESTADWYRRAARELAGTSERQSSWCLAVADDPAVLALLDALPRPARQPSLLFAVAAHLGAPDAPAEEWTSWLRANADAVAAALPGRRVQTNEPGRAAPLAIALARIPGPVALIELGAAAGLCLIPDRYGYRFRTPDGTVGLGDGAPVLACEVDDAALIPAALPDIRWRVGVDLDPVDVRGDDAVRWLEASLPPDRPDRRERLAAAVRTTRLDPPRVVGGDALARLPALAAEAPADATLVVASLGCAVYLPPADRARLCAEVAAVGARLVSLEARAAIPEVAERWAELASEGRVDPAAGFVLAFDGEPLAESSPHGDLVRAVRPAGRTGGASARP